MTNTDTADVAAIKKRAYSDFKERNKLSLKEFTALNTVAKSQEARLRDRKDIGKRRKPSASAATEAGLGPPKKAAPKPPAKGG